MPFKQTNRRIGPCGFAEYRLLISRDTQTAPTPFMQAVILPILRHFAHDLSIYLCICSKTRNARQKRVFTYVNTRLTAHFSSCKPNINFILPSYRDTHRTRRFDAAADFITSILALRFMYQIRAKAFSSNPFKEPQTPPSNNIGSS